MNATLSLFKEERCHEKRKRIYYSHEQKALIWDRYKKGDSIGDYFTSMLARSMNRGDVAEMVKFWDGEFCLKDIMSREDTRKTVEIGSTVVIISNHGGRQFDGSHSTFVQLAEIVGEVDVIFDSGGRCGTHVLTDSVKAFTDSNGITGDMIVSQPVIGTNLRDLIQ